MKVVYERKFINFKCYEMYSYFDSAEEIADYLESYEPSDTPWQKLKIND